MTDYTNGAVAALAAQLIADQQDRDALFVAWLNGSADGGPNDDGRYPLPHPSGSLLVPCWARITDALNGAAVGAGESAEGAAASATSAAQSKTDITAIHASIELLLTEARTLRAQSLMFRQEAASEHAAARAERETCQQLKADMQTMLDDWDAAHP